PAAGTLPATNSGSDETTRATPSISTRAYSQPASSMTWSSDRTSVRRRLSTVWLTGRLPSSGSFSRAGRTRSGVSNVTCVTAASQPNECLNFWVAYQPFVWLTPDMTDSPRPRVAIVGSAQTELRAEHGDRQHIDLIAQAVTQALLGTGLTMR